MHATCASPHGKPDSMRSSAKFAVAVSTRNSPGDSCCSTVRVSAPISVVIASLTSFKVKVAGNLKVTDRLFRSAILARGKAKNSLCPVYVNSWKFPLKK